MKAITIPIKSHTKVRRPASRYITLVMENTYNVPFDQTPKEPTILVQDIKRGLDNPILLLKPKPNDTFRYNPNKLAKELWQIDPKPKSLLERITNKIRRK